MSQLACRQLTRALCGAKSVTLPPKFGNPATSVVQRVDCVAGTEEKFGGVDVVLLVELLEMLLEAELVRPPVVGLEG